MKPCLKIGRKDGVGWAEKVTGLQNKCGFYSPDSTSYKYKIFEKNLNYIGHVVFPHHFLNNTFPKQKKYYFI